MDNETIEPRSNYFCSHGGTESKVVPINGFFLGLSPLCHHGCRHQYLVVKLNHHCKYSRVPNSLEFRINGGDWKILKNVINGGMEILESLINW